MAARCSDCQFNIDMLTATYSFIAIAAEQKHARGRLQKLQQRLQAALKGKQHPDTGVLDTVWNKLTQFDKYFRNRKVDAYLIPVLRNTDGEADALIADLERLSAAGAAIVRSIGERAADHVHSDALCQAMERYCRKVSLRLDKEEQALLPLARRCLSTEAWFSIASQLLAEQADEPERGRLPRMQPKRHADIAAMPAH